LNGSDFGYIQMYIDTDLIQYRSTPELEVITMEMKRKRKRSGFTAILMVISMIVLSFMYLIQILYSHVGMFYSQMEEQRDLRMKSMIDAGTIGDSTANITVISWEGIDGMNKLVANYFDGRLLCDVQKIRSTANDPNLPIVVNITFNCKQLYEESGYGTGNYIALIYGIRLVANVFGNVDVHITCTDAEETKKDLVLPWLMGYFPARPVMEKSPIPISINNMCRHYFLPPLSYMYKEIQYDLRKMAIGLLGILRQDHPSALFAEDNLWSQSARSIMKSSIGSSVLSIPKRNSPPLLGRNRYELDDTVIHFRCGDLMDSEHPHFGFMKFSGYTRHISHEASSIGIITQPFELGAQSRKLDSDQYKRDRCRIVVFAMIQYIKQRYPKARVQIRNNVKETIAMTYSRMIMANQTIAGISSFGVMPAIATFGTGYIRLPESTMQSRWIERPRIDNLTNNVVLFQETNIIPVTDIKRMWENYGEDAVVEWFRNDSMTF
jgi:hypothetical protein